MRVYLLVINFVKMYDFILTASSKEYQKIAELKYPSLRKNSIILVIFSFFCICSHTSPDYNCPWLVALHPSLKGNYLVIFTPNDSTNIWSYIFTASQINNILQFYSIFERILLDVISTSHAVEQKCIAPSYRWENWGLLYWCNWPSLIG